jgi:hypothetical protein
MAHYCVRCPSDKCWVCVSGLTGIVLTGTVNRQNGCANAEAVLLNLSEGQPTLQASHFNGSDTKRPAV